MPEDLPVTKRINVMFMVGITRSKVIYMFFLQSFGRVHRTRKRRKTGQRGHRVQEEGMKKRRKGLEEREEDRDRKRTRPKTKTEDEDTVKGKRGGGGGGGEEVRRSKNPSKREKAKAQSKTSNTIQDNPQNTPAGRRIFSLALALALARSLSLSVSLYLVSNTA